MTESTPSRAPDVLTDLSDRTERNLRFRKDISVKLECVKGIQCMIEPPSPILRRRTIFPQLKRLARLLDLNLKHGGLWVQLTEEATFCRLNSTKHARSSRPTARLRTPVCQSSLFQLVGGKFPYHGRNAVPTPPQSFVVDDLVPSASNFT